MITRILAALTCAVLAEPFAAAADINVGPGQSIQAAIVSANPGDRVLVQPGTYNEAIDFLGKGIEVIGVAGPSVTTIDATGTGTSAVSFVSNEPPTALLQGFSVTGGTGRFAGGSFGGGGIRVHGAPPTVRECRIVQNSLSQSGQGAGVLASGQWPASIVQMIDCVVADNQGRGVVGNMIVRRCTITRNSDGGLAGIGTHIDLSECLVADNNTSGNGGGLGVIVPGSLAMSRCVFAGNQAGQDGGGVHVSLTDFATGVSVAGCWFVGNSAGGVGGGAAVTKSSDVGFFDGVAISRSVFANNTAAGGVGGGAHLSISNFTAPTQIVTVEACSFSGNGPSGVHGVGTVVNVRRSVFWGQPNPITAPAFATVSVTESDVQGGWPGSGNISADPLFADPVNGDLHLLAGSPCIDALPTTGALTDFEGDARDAFDDIGADEFAPHVYVRGQPAANATVTIDVVGPPGSPVSFFSSLLRDDVGVATPYGTFGLGFPLIPGFPIGLGALPATGRLSIPVTLPPGVPPGVSVHNQVFYGTTVSNVESIRFE